MTQDVTGALRRNLYLRGLRADAWRWTVAAGCLAGALAAVARIPGEQVVAAAVVGLALGVAVTRSALAWLEVRRATGFARLWLRGED